MEALNSTAGWAASAALMGVTVIPLGAFWGSSLRRRSGEEPQPVKIAFILLQIALPVFIAGIVLDALVALIFATSSGSLEVSVYIRLASSFLVTAGGILTTQTVYLGGICVLYLVLAKQKWWKLLRLDALIGAALLLIIDIAWLATNISTIRKGDGVVQIMTYLIIIVNVSLCLVAAGVVGVAIYTAHKLKTRTYLAVGNMSALLLSASILWLTRCAFVMSVDIKKAIPEWTEDELSLQKILYPILDFWLSTAVLGLIGPILRHPIWSDPAAMPDRAPGVAQHPGYPHPQYGYQQYYPQPGTYQEQGMYQQQGMHQQQVMYQQQPQEPSPTPVPAMRMHNADATPSPAGLQGARAPQLAA